MEISQKSPVKRRLWIAIAVTLAAVAAVGIGFALLTSPPSAPSASPTDAAVDDDDDDPSEDPLTTVPTPTAAPLSSDEEVEVKRASEAAQAVVVALDEVGQRGDGSTVGLEAIASDWVLGEMQSHAQEQFDLGYTQVGEAVVTSVDPTNIDLAGDPATIILKVCVDVSGIDVLDAAGNSLKDSLYNPGHPVAHLYGAVFRDETWKISTHEIPDAQDCATT